MKLIGYMGDMGIAMSAEDGKWDTLASARNKEAPLRVGADALLQRLMGAWDLDRIDIVENFLATDDEVAGD